MAINKTKVASSFSRSAQGYAEHAVLQRTVAERLLERLELVSISPKVIIDAGSGPGGAARQLAKRYKGAQVLQLDLSMEMLNQSRSQDSRFFSKQQYVCGDAESLPLVKNSTELVFSSLMLQWCNDLDAAFTQIKNTLKRQGLFLFATLGPDTLKELRSSWAEVDDDVHVNTFIDMHDVGDALIRAGFVEPVLDVENIIMTYDDCSSLMKDLKTLGANNANDDRSKGLTGKNKIEVLESAYEKYRSAGRLPATYEVVYGHAWTPLQETLPDSLANEAYFPISSLKIRD
ncbi:MAG: malonyl-ACP O-methyltransferase BioC [Gammaproteobacteria bacterium]